LSTAELAPVDVLTITRPDDLHLHLRDHDELRAVLPYTVRQFARAIVMPNLTPPVLTLADAHSYRNRIHQALPTGSDFEPLMTLYLTEDTKADEVRRAMGGGVIAVKLYPAHATTNAEAGVRDIRRCRDALACMEEIGMPLLVHGESTRPEVDVFDRERTFIDDTLIPLRREFPGLKVVFEHITTREAAQYVRDADGAIAATITAHHLLLNRNALFDGGFRPHHYCLPVLKREEHRKALVDVATGGNPRFFLGTDSAPHSRLAKEAACGCAGCFTAPAALALYAQAFDLAGRLDRLGAFASEHGASFYGLPRNRGRITLRRAPYRLPEEMPFPADTIVPFMAGKTLDWSVDLPDTH